MELIDDERHLVQVSRHDLDQILACMRETWEALEDWEFHTRLGWYPADIQALEDSIVRIRESLPPDPTDVS